MSSLYLPAVPAELDSAAGAQFVGQAVESKSKTRREMRILSISPDSQDHAALNRAIDGMPWQIASATTCRQAISRLSRQHISVIFCECSLEDGTWKDILAHVSRAAKPPLLVVTSRLADDRLWAEVLNLGGYDVLAKPFNEREIRHVLISALMPGVKPIERTAGGVS